MKRNYARVKNPTNEARDAWIYARCYAGVPYTAIVARLLANAHGWRPIESHQGLHSAALRHADRHGLPPPPPRPPGTPATGTRAAPDPAT